MSPARDRPPPDTTLMALLRLYRLQTSLPRASPVLMATQEPPQQPRVQPVDLIPLVVVDKIPLAMLIVLAHGRHALLRVRMEQLGHGRQRLKLLDPEQPAPQAPVRIVVMVMVLA